MNKTRACSSEWMVVTSLDGSTRIRSVIRSRKSVVRDFADSPCRFLMQIRLNAFLLKKVVFLLHLLTIEAFTEFWSSSILFHSLILLAVWINQTDLAFELNSSNRLNRLNHLNATKSFSVWIADKLSKKLGNFVCCYLIFDLPDCIHFEHLQSALSLAESSFNQAKY